MGNAVPSVPGGPEEAVRLELGVNHQPLDERVETIRALLKAACVDGTLEANVMILVEALGGDLEVARQEAAIDDLTGLWNKKVYLHRLREMGALRSRSLRPNPRSESSLPPPPAPRVSTVMFDVDHFKHKNDTYGHGAGDQILKELGIRVKGCVRVSDTAARWGGEEFTVILPETGAREAVF